MIWCVYFIYLEVIIDLDILVLDWGLFVFGCECVWKVLD